MNRLTMSSVRRMTPDGDWERRDMSSDVRSSRAARIGDRKMKKRTKGNAIFGSDEILFIYSGLLLYVVH